MSVSVPLTEVPLHSRTPSVNTDCRRRRQLWVCQGRQSGEWTVLFGRRAPYLPEVLHSGLGPICPSGTLKFGGRVEGGGGGVDSEGVNEGCESRKVKFGEVELSLQIPEGEEFIYSISVCKMPVQEIVWYTNLIS